MKRKCKNVDITSMKFICDAVQDCLNHKTTEKLNRKRTRKYLNEHDNDINKIALEIQNEIKNRNLVLEPVRYVNIIDRSNGKERVLTVESIKQQMMDYIAYRALSELDSRFGYYQINVRQGGSPLMAMRYVQGWMKGKNVKYVVQMDVHKCYPSISKENMMKWLERHVNNSDLLWLINELLSTCEIGLPIGSYLSIKLCALYMSDLYHYTERNFRYYRRGKEHRAVLHQLFYLDDVFLFGSNARKLTESAKEFIAEASRMGLSIKPTWKMICLKENREDTHIDILGYRVYHNRITMRRRDYLKCRKSLRKYKKSACIKNARTIVALSGMFLKYTDSIKLSRKYNANFYINKARKEISRYDKSNISRETSRSYC